MLLLRFILIIAILYLVFRWVVTKILPQLLGNYMKKMSNQMHENLDPDRFNHSGSNHEGEITIKGMPDKAPAQPRPNGGEYVDFEEIKED